MSEPTDTAATTTVADDDWLSPSHQSETLASAPAEPGNPRRLLAVRAGLVVVGAVVGGVVVAAVSHGSPSPSTPTAAIGAPFAGGPSGAAGGLDGEQRLAGTLVSVGSSTVTVRSSAGTATYGVTSRTEIVRNGQLVALSALRPGDAVFVHVYPSGSGSRLLVERIFAGTRT